MAILGTTVALMPSYALIAAYLGKSLTALTFGGAVFTGLGHGFVDNQILQIKRIRGQGEELEGLFEVQISKGILNTQRVAVKLEDFSSMRHTISDKNLEAKTGGIALISKYYDLSSK